jgi:hypothetical protein
MPTDEHSRTGVDLYWIPLGAGGVGFVRLNGRVYEWSTALAERRRPMQLFHSALEVRDEGVRFTIESAWPIPDEQRAARGVVVVGPVFDSRISRLRSFRYEVRCWRDGVIPDVAAAVASPLVLTTDPERVSRLLTLVASVPPLTWGRDEMRTGEMWNSNSVVSWLVAGSGLPANEIKPPTGGRAPGWGAGIAIAQAVDATPTIISSPRPGGLS